MNTAAYLVFTFNDAGQLLGAGVFSEPEPTALGPRIQAVAGIVGHGNTYEAALVDLRARLREQRLSFGREGSPVRRMIDAIADGARFASVPSEGPTPGQRLDVAQMVRGSSSCEQTCLLAETLRELYLPERWDTVPAALRIEHARSIAQTPLEIDAHYSLRLRMLTRMAKRFAQLTADAQHALDEGRTEDHAEMQSRGADLWRDMQIVADVDTSLEGVE